MMNGRSMRSACSKVIVVGPAEEDRIVRNRTWIASSAFSENKTG